MSKVVLDASALLALLNSEPGEEVVAKAIPGAIMSTVNLSEVVAKLAARFGDPSVSCQLDEIAGLVLLELAGLDEAELDRGGVDALLEIGLVEAEAVAQELDDEVVAGKVVGLGHGA